METLDSDPEMGLAGIPAKTVPKKEEPPKDVKILIGQTGTMHPVASQFMTEYGAVPKIYGRRRKTLKKKKSRKAGRRKTRK